MTAQSISAVVQQAVEWTGMEHVPVQDRTRLVSDHGSSYLARAFEDYLRMLAVRHICCYYSPHHPQSNGKLERFHERLNARVNLVVYKWIKPGVEFFSLEPSLASVWNRQLSVLFGQSFRQLARYVIAQFRNCPQEISPLCLW